MTNPERKRMHSPHQPTGTWIRRERRLAIYLRDRLRCVYCAADLHGASPADLTLDHLDCRQDGGANHETNLVTACRSCNSRRADRPWAEFADARATHRIERRWESLEKYLILARDLIARRQEA